MNTKRTNSKSSIHSRIVGAGQQRSYEVSFLTNGLLKEGTEVLSRRLEHRRCLLVTTPTVADLYGRELFAKLALNDNFCIDLLILDCCENSKRLSQVEKICLEASEKGLDRNAVIIGLGGGVLTDVVTMAASWIRRGIGTIRIPTTLLGQVDGGIGVKGAVNFHGQKNWLGCYYPPEIVLVDSSFLATLDENLIRCGLAEIIKVALIRSPDLFVLLENHAKGLIESRFQRPDNVSTQVIWASIEAMLEELESNLYEDQTYERLVDYGHTFSSELESLSNFSLPHGIAVSVDMAFSCVIARELGLLDRQSCQRALGLLLRCGLPIYSDSLDVAACKRAAEAAVRHRGGKMNLVVPKSIGAGCFLESPTDLPDELLQSALRELAMFDCSPVSVNQNNSSLVFDVGGSTIRCARFDQSERLIHDVQTVETRSFVKFPNESADTLLDFLEEDLISLSKGVLNNGQADNITIAFAGPVDESGGILAAPTIFGDECPSKQLKPRLKRIWPGSSISILNDVTAAGYRYLRDPCDDLCIVTVSSGIGNKIFVAGKPLVGAKSAGGEIGHLRVDFTENAHRCDCGGIGHLGSIASGRGAVRTAVKIAQVDPKAFLDSIVSEAVGGNPKAMTSRALVAGFKSGDGWATKIIEQTAAPLARILAGIHLSIGIQRFVIYGGFGLALGEKYRQMLSRFATESCWQSEQDFESLIELGFPDDHSGLIGAGRYSAEFMRRN